MIYLQSKYEHYLKFVNENKTDRLYKGIKITTTDNKISNLLKLSTNVKINEEIFENSIECEYSISKSENNHIKVTFNSKSETKYRIDIYKIIEGGEIINHIGFSVDSERLDNKPTNQVEQNEHDIEYERLTNKYEIYDILGRIRFILIDMVINKIITNQFCIGGTSLLKKNSLYEFFLKVVVGKDGYEKRKTNCYPKIEWGLYFKI